MWEMRRDYSRAEWGNRKKRPKTGLGNSTNSLNFQSQPRKEMTNTLSAENLHGFFKFPKQFFPPQPSFLLR